MIEILDNKYWEDAYDYVDYADIKELLLNHVKNLTDFNNTKLIYKNDFFEANDKFLYKEF